MSIVSEVAKVLHEIINDLGPTARHDELHAQVDAAVAAAEPDTSSEPDTPSASELIPEQVPVAAPVFPSDPGPFGTESDPHAAQ